MKTSITFLLFLSSVISHLSLFAKDKEYTPNFDSDIPNYFVDFGFQMVETTYRNNRLKRTMLVLSREDTEDGRILLTLQTPNPNSPGRIELEIGGDSNIRLELTRPPEIDEATKLFEQGHFLESLEILRPIAYPLFKYVDLPRNIFDVHDVIDLTLSAMFKSKQYSEMANVLGRFKFDKIDTKYMSMALAVSEAFIENKQFDIASKLFEKIPFSSTDREQRILAMSFTEKLREAGEYRRAQFFYKRLYALEDFIYRREAQLWIVYCNIRLEQPDLARIFLNEIGEISREEREFSLYQLINARLALLDEDYIKGIRIASEATVFSRLGYSWIPELLYTNAECYEALNKADVATNVYEQVIIFFEGSEWANKSQEKITELAPEAERLRKIKEAEKAAAAQS